MSEMSECCIVQALQVLHGRISSFIAIYLIIPSWHTSLMCVNCDKRDFFIERAPSPSCAIWFDHWLYGVIRQNCKIISGEILTSLVNDLWSTHMCVYYVTPGAKRVWQHECSRHLSYIAMGFTIGSLFEASLLFINAIAILNEDRFLVKGTV